MPQLNEKSWMIFSIFLFFIFLSFSSNLFFSFFKSSNSNFPKSFFYFFSIFM